MQRRKVIKNVSNVLKVIMVAMWFIALCSVMTYEVNKITFKECMGDIVVSIVFILFNWFILGTINTKR